jgi:hypothetical protein
VTTAGRGGTAAGVWAAGGGVGPGGANDGRTGVCGTINLGAGGGSADFGGATGVCVAGGVTVAGFAATGGADGFGGAAGVAGACLLMMALSTSPGLEMFDRSILVLISSDSRPLGRDAGLLEA